jgi:hypothetical protein
MSHKKFKGHVGFCAFNESHSYEALQHPEHELILFRLSCHYKSVHLGPRIMIVMLLERARFSLSFSL